MTSNKQLFHYQQQGLEFMLVNEADPDIAGGMLALDMGMGKTGTFNNSFPSQRFLQLRYF
jgi:SNF2 family DNA or RNA helicase